MFWALATPPRLAGADVNVLELLAWGVSIETFAHATGAHRSAFVLDSKVVLDIDTHDSAKREPLAAAHRLLRELPACRALHEAGAVKRHAFTTENVGADCASRGALRELRRFAAQLGITLTQVSPSGRCY